MIEYCIFPSAPDSDSWKPSFIVHAVSDEAVKNAFPSADRIYSCVKGKLVRVL